MSPLHTERIHNALLRPARLLSQEVETPLKPSNSWRPGISSAYRFSEQRQSVDLVGDVDHGQCTLLQRGMKEGHWTESWIMCP